MSLIELFFSPFGRAGRGPYLVTIFGLNVLGVSISKLQAAAPQGQQHTANVLAAIIALASVSACAAITIKRLHDLDRSGWWAGLYMWPSIFLSTLPVILATIPIAIISQKPSWLGWILLVFSIVILVLFAELALRPGSLGANRYGANAI